MVPPTVIVARRALPRLVSVRSGLELNVFVWDIVVNAEYLSRFNQFFGLLGKAYVLLYNSHVHPNILIFTSTVK